MMKVARLISFADSRCTGAIRKAQIGSKAVLFSLTGLLTTDALAFSSGHEQPETRQQHAEVDQAMRLAAADRREEAQRVLRTALLNNPSDESAYEALVSVSQSVELSAVSPSCDAAQQRLPSDFATLQTPRFILLSDADAFSVHQHGRWVERACEEFERFAREHDLRPLPLQHKLVCVLFEDHGEYQAFARHNDGMNNPAFTGYYSPRHDRVVFSLRSRDEGDRTKKSRDVKPSERVLASAGKDVLGFESQPGAASSKSGEGHSTREDCCGTGHDTGRASAAKCVHETIHQLMFHTRIMTPDTQYPLWICEGLSTAFETDSPEEPFGPDRDYEPRRRVFHTMLERGDLVNLRELVTLTSLSSKGAKTTRAVYHQSYALVTWLCRNHPDAVRNYLNSMRDEPAGRLPASRHLELFEHAFGNVGDVERDWLDHELAALYEHDGR